MLANKLSGSFWKYKNEYQRHIYWRRCMLEFLLTYHLCWFLISNGDSHSVVKRSSPVRANATRRFIFLLIFFVSGYLQYNNNKFTKALVILVMIIQHNLYNLCWIFVRKWAHVFLSVHNATLNQLFFSRLIFPSNKQLYFEYNSMRRTNYIRLYQFQALFVIYNDNMLCENQCSLISC